MIDAPPQSALGWRNATLPLGELEAARAALERALTILEATYGPDHPQVASTLGNLGNVSSQLGS